VPTPVSHAAVGFAIAAWTQQRPPTRRVCLVAAACAVLPDIDYFEWPLAHRSLTHSLAFAIAAAAAATFIFFRGPQWSRQRARVAVSLAVAALSHGFLDALSSYSYGVAFFAPFSQQRYRFAWTPLRSSTTSLAGQLLQEALVLFLPAVLLAWLAFKVRLSPQATAR
jgi:inner membrane protein